MADPTDAVNEDELVDYEEEEETIGDGVKVDEVAKDGVKKGSYVGIHSTGFRDFLLKHELLRSIVDAGFEHPSEVQQECIPQAVLGMDVICQAKSGMGKTAVFVLAVLQQMADDEMEGDVKCLVLCHTRELAYQICHEFERFCKYLQAVKVAVFYGGVAVKTHRDMLKNDPPNIVVGTPGRILQLAQEKNLKLNKVKHFILDECDKCLDSLDMRRQVQDIFRMTPRDKQVMMFSATMSQELRIVCKKFMHDVCGVATPFLSAAGGTLLSLFPFSFCFLLLFSDHQPRVDNPSGSGRNGVGVGVVLRGEGRPWQHDEHLAKGAIVVVDAS
eukprot:TRINITY_DN141_c0_g1_i2.p2 TRINITY_DN141_c0_g1~~TRINITY_DN141_c0_g1_i2.p2  ORF type:complete len:346 (-),score=95.05 TRINITY_DN141_c0_g1_i2:2331-3317(-)